PRAPHQGAGAPRLQPPPRAAPRDAPTPAEAPEAPAAAAPPPAPTPAPASPAATPPATGPTERERDDPPQDAPACDENQEHYTRDHQAHGERHLAGFVGGRGHRRPGQREPEFARERLRDQIDAQRQPRAIVLAREVRSHGVADPPHRRVGEEPLGAPARRDEHLPGTGAVVFQGDEQYDDAQVLRRVAGRALGADAPLAPDLEGDVARRAVADVGQRDDGD